MQGLEFLVKAHLHVLHLSNYPLLEVFQLRMAHRLLSSIGGRIGGSQWLINYVGWCLISTRPCLRYVGHVVCDTVALDGSGLRLSHGCHCGLHWSHYLRNRFLLLLL